MNETMELAPQAALPVERRAPSVPEMLQAVIDRGVTSENAAALEKMVDLYERMQEKEAEKAFAVAFKALQSESSAIKAMRPVKCKDGTLKYKFAPYEDIMEQVKPLLEKHGFTVSFSTEFVEGRIVKICTLQHIGGHSRINKFAAKVGSGPPGCSETQADGAASTYAKRFALCDALNITIEKDSDANVEGDGTKITKEQAASLRERAKATGSNEALFLTFAKAATYEDILASNYSKLDASLRKKESTK